MPKILDNIAPKLVSEARRQMLEKGYASLNIRDLAKNCDVCVGTVYNYFPSKDALVANILLEDWKAGLERIRLAAHSGAGMEGAAQAVYRELTLFLEQYREVFDSASATVPAPPKKYHLMLRSQISRILRPLCPDDFTGDFLAESLLTWTVEGVPFSQLWEILNRVIS